jgi:hypothetical protein
MTVGKNRTRLAVEQMEDRCTPSALGGGLADHFPAQHAGPRAAVSSVRATHEHAVPIKLAYQCFGDISSSTASVTGFGTVLGHWTGQGQIDNAVVDPVADRAEISGTITVVTANGDQLFVSFTASWQLSTGEGTESINVTGGTGRFAGASGGGSLDCTITGDPALQTFSCDCKGNGTLILAHP